MRYPEFAIKQTALADACGVTPQAVNGWLETGRIHKKHLTTIARLCGVKVDYFLDESIDLPLRGSSDAHPVQSTDISIPKLSVRASAGNGVMQMEAEYQVGSVQIPEQWLRKNIVCSSFKNLRTITVFGDSMMETLNDGDLVFVDTGAREIDRDGIYVCTLDGELFIKTFERRPAEGVIWMRSDNRRKYPDPHVITKERMPFLRILARAVFAWNGRKL